MSRDRLIQLFAAVIALSGIVGSALLIGPINKQRRDLRLSYDVKVGDQVEPQVALLTTVAGSFRGVLVDALWYRAEMEKRDGRYYEANALADWITTLQPRFAQVWAFNAWNMAYNISVGTHTPAERWDWVSKGIRLLRDKGIVYNPNSVQLYRELAWIWFHKIGGGTDDMNLYYKAKVAQKWQQLLGAQDEGAPTEEVLASFKPIRDAADRYFTSELGRPGHQTKAMLDKLQSAGAIDADQAKDFKHMSVERLAEHLTRLRADADDAGLSADSRQLLARTIERVKTVDNRAGTDRLVRLYDNAPATEALVGQLRDLGYDLNESTLRDIGRLQAMIRYGPFSRRGPQVLLNWADQALPRADQQLIRVMLNPDFHQGWQALMPYLRAKVLVNDYHMDPAQMYDLMEDFGPLDWRHPMSHAAYWAALGIERSGQLRDTNRIDLINTDRRVIQSMQSLMHAGRVNYDPFASTPRGVVNYQPDPRFIPAYEKAINHAMGRVKAAQGTDEEYSGGVPNSFQAGYENFLQTAVVYSYLYGNMDQARKYYRKVRREFGSKAAYQRSGEYNQPLEDFVMREVLNNSGAQDFNRAFITSRIQAALTQGLANNRQDVYSRNMRLAQEALNRYNQTRGTPNPTAGNERLGLPAFADLVRDVYVDFMQNGRIPLFRRSRVYQATPSMQLLNDTYPRFRKTVAQQIARINPNADPSFLFPPPPGWDQNQANPQAPKPMQDEPDPTVERK